MNRIGLRLSFAGLLFVFCSVPLRLAHSQDDAGSDRRVGRGGLDLGWGKGEEWDADEDAKEKSTPTPTPTPKKGDDSFFKRDVEDTGAGDKM